MRRSYKGISINTSKNTHETVFGLVREDKSAIVADIPSGGGAFVQRLLDHGYINVKAIDIENILEIDHSDFHQADMTKTFPFEDGSLDVMVCIDGIEHISQQFDFAREVNRVLTDGGEFIISTPNISSLRSRWKWLMTGHHHKCSSPLDEDNPTPLHHIGMISYPEIRYLLHTCGFRIDCITTNRIKAISWPFALLLPFVYLSTLWTYRKTGRRDGTAQINREVFKTMFSKAILFGETMIVRAVKVTKP